MYRHFILCLSLTCLISQTGNSQKVIEFGIKPTEFILLNFEANLAIGNQKARYGIILSWRPATQDSGLVKGIGGGAAGGYGHPHFNRLYNSYTVGLYHKIYLNKTHDLFYETDIFYRNWKIENKPAEYRNVESYRFKGLRTENVNVYGLKLLIGKTSFLGIKDKKIKPYLDIYGGVGIRYKEENYETFNGTVRDVYYSYKKDHFTYIWVTPQIGIKLGFIRSRTD